MPKRSFGGSLPVAAVGPVNRLMSLLRSPKGAVWLEALESFLQGRGSEVEPRWRTVNACTVHVNYDAELRLPCAGAKPVRITGKSGWGIVELRGGNDLYVDHCRVGHFLANGQARDPFINGFDLLGLLSGQTALHPVIVDVLVENAHLIPESWSGVDQDRRILLTFFGVIFGSPVGDQSVRCLVRIHGTWRSAFILLDSQFDEQMPAAVTEEL